MAPAGLTGGLPGGEGAGPDGGGLDESFMAVTFT